MNALSVMLKTEHIHITIETKRALDSSERRMISSFFRQQGSLRYAVSGIDSDPGECDVEVCVEVNGRPSYSEYDVADRFIEPPMFDRFLVKPDKEAEVPA